MFIENAFLCRNFGQFSAQSLNHLTPKPIYVKPKTRNIKCTNAEAKTITLCNGFNLIDSTILGTSN